MKKRYTEEQIIGAIKEHGPRFRAMDEARTEIDIWRNHYNNVRLHSAHNYTPPAEFVRKAV